MEFLTTGNCDLMLSQQCLKINGETILCLANSGDAQTRCCRVAVFHYENMPIQIY